MKDWSNSSIFKQVAGEQIVEPEKKLLISETEVKTCVKVLS